ncbi:MAG: hypothetical protein KDA78_17930 [Planctomycetaceae bacterium]|nr:hypothetical protein [Planctomycetaceae bacterium]
MRFPILLLALIGTCLPLQSSRLQAEEAVNAPGNNTFAVGCASCSRSHYSWKTYATLSEACEAALEDKHLYVNVLQTQPDAVFPSGKRWFLHPEIPFRIATRSQTAGAAQWTLAPEVLSEAEAQLKIQELNEGGVKALLVEEYRSLEFNSRTAYPSNE